MTLTQQVLAQSQKLEYIPSINVYDLREYHPTREVGVCVLGGFIGELLLTFNALNDYILSNPNLSEFKLTADKIEPFLVDWMKEADFPEGTCVLKLTQSA